ncbi:MAG: cell division protein SepF [Anaerovoracaceae bacterium]
MVIEPKSFDECPKLVDSLKGRRPVIINLEKIETETAKKIFDFLSGATLLNGNVQRLRTIFLSLRRKALISQPIKTKGDLTSGGRILGIVFRNLL